MTSFWHHFIKKRNWCLSDCDWKK